VKRISITLDDDLEIALDAYISAQDARPSLTAVVQAAIREFLTGRGRSRAAPTRASKLHENIKYKK
jgi:predicted transcriptional regulator